MAPKMHMTEKLSDKDGLEGSFREGVVIKEIDGTLIAKISDQLSKPSLKYIDTGLSIDISQYQYIVAPQDIMQITVWDHPELTIPAGQFRTAADTGNLVQADGTIFYPYIGQFHVAGKSMNEIRVGLTKRLESYVESPQVDVRVAAFRGRSVYVTGQVNKPSRLPVSDIPLNVIKALTMVGGTLKSADLQHVSLTRSGKTYWLNLQALYERGDPRANVLLKDGDMLTVLDNNLNKVFVLGEVAKPASLLIQNGRMSLAEAIADSSGFGPMSNAGQVYVIRGTPRARELDDIEITERSPLNHFTTKVDLEIYHLDASLADALLLGDHFPLQARDVVYVAPTELSRFSRVFKNIADVVNASFQTLVLSRSLGLIK
ncbi:MAG: polysaccharide biosynthesis/export family protein [Mariprofundaceae bacterium]|nr:polysaccharide biosynthesis/export family protein [Mariprofundaceae bacterium]